MQELQFNSTPVQANLIDDSSQSDLSSKLRKRARRRFSGIPCEAPLSSNSNRPWAISGRRVSIERDPVAPSRAAPQCSRCYSREFSILGNSCVDAAVSRTRFRYSLIEVRLSVPPGAVRQHRLARRRPFRRRFYRRRVAQGSAKAATDNTDLARSSHRWWPYNER